jgi:hypothetical protein
VQDVEQAEDFAHPAAYDRQRWAWGPIMIAPWW